MKREEGGLKSAAFAILDMKPMFYSPLSGLCPLLPIVFLLLPIAGLCAQTQAITLPEALRMADEQSIEIRRRALAVDRFAAEVDIVGEDYTPDVVLSADYNLNIQRPVLIIGPDVPFNTTGETEAFVIGGRHAAEASVTVTQSFYDPRRRLRRRVAESGVSVAQAELEVARATVHRDVERSFYRALFARSERDTRQAQIKQSTANLDFTLARFRQGRALPLDTVTAAATLARARADARRADFDYQRTLMRLARQIGVKDYQNLELKGDLEIPSFPGPSGGDMTLIPGRLNSAEIRLAQTRLAAAHVALEAEERITAPTVDLVGRARTLGQSPDPLPDQWRWAMTSFIGLSASYNFAELWRGDPRRQVSEIRVRENELQIADILRQDSIAVETLLFTMQSARAQLEAEEATIGQAGKAIEITMILYREGRATWLDVETAQNRLLDAQLAAERVKLQFLDTYVELKAIVGSE